MFLFKNVDHDDRLEEKREAMTAIINACVDARHEDIMQLYGMPKDYFTVSTPMESILRPSRAGRRVNSRR